jgi:hypothetical protein
LQAAHDELSRVAAELDTLQRERSDARCREWLQVRERERERERDTFRRTHTSAPALPPLAEEGVHTPQPDTPPVGCYQLP